LAGRADTEIRLARREDALAVAQVHVRSWQAGYRNLLPDAYLDSLRAEDRAARYDFESQDPARPITFVAVDGKAICGFATVAPDSGELAALYVSPDRWRQGIGAALVVAARNQLTSLGYRQAVLWVLRGNARGERFYERDGWKNDAVQRVVTLWGVTVDEIRYSRDL
jgi:GNAT superfamily N-acetyltransferase